MERLDKILSNMGYGSRKEVRGAVRKGLVSVDGEVIRDESMKFNPEKSHIVFGNEKVNYRKYIYLMMNKPEGYISATEDGRDPVVVELLSDEHRTFSPYPVGRLDKDTVGLLLLTNNGELNHRLISPRWKVPKTYHAVLRDEPQEGYEVKIREGIVLEDGYRCMPGEFSLVSEEDRKVSLTIMEGKFHQVKRMFEALGNKVEHLERVSFGPFPLDGGLKRGEYRELTEEEIAELGRITELTEL